MHLLFDLIMRCNLKIMRRSFAHFCFFFCILRFFFFFCHGMASRRLLLSIFLFRFHSHNKNTSFQWAGSHQLAIMPFFRLNWNATCIWRVWLLFVMRQWSYRLALPVTSFLSHFLRKPLHHSHNWDERLYLKQ